MSREITYQHNDDQRTVVVDQTGATFTVRVGDATFAVTARAGEHGRLDLEVEGRRLRAYVARQGALRYVAVNGQTWTLCPPDPRRQRSDTSGGSLAAAMPGRVLDVLVQPGAMVHKGEPLVLLEAMKMELRIAAPADGVVMQVRCAAGDVVERGQVLVEMQEA
jgi:acetyl/propionyl-CoA carboxylase alpha subunit